MNRRHFIQQSLLLSGALILPQYLLALPGSQNVRGRVSAAGRGLRSVVVSDGYNVLLTDKNGDYEFATHEEARFVFISIPAGYDFPQDQNLARHYRSLALDSSFDFELVKLKHNDDKHQFIVWADPQVKNAEEVRQMMSTSVVDVQEYVRSQPSGTLIHGLGVGDLAWDELELSKDYSKAVELMGIPFFQALGNHDMDYRLGDDETSDRTFQKFFGPTWYSFNRGKAHYVVLDDVRYLGEDRDYDGHISEAQLAWLKKDLEYVGKNDLLVIAVHIPVHNSVKNREELYSVLSGFSNVHIMSGHTHYNRNVIQNGVYEHNHGAVCGAWWTGPICEDGTPRGYGIYEVAGRDLKWHYKSTGFALENQISISLSTLTRQKRLVANVWNWDPEWKVEYFMDGRPMGELKNEKAYDELAVKLYKGKDLPARRGFPEPKLNDHMFAAHFGPEVKEVKVVATDRFGRKFEKTAKFNS